MSRPGAVSNRARPTPAAPSPATPPPSPPSSGTTSGSGRPAWNTLSACTISSIFCCGIVDFRPRPARTFPSLPSPPPRTGPATPEPSPASPRPARRSSHSPHHRPPATAPSPAELADAARTATATRPATPRAVHRSPSMRTRVCSCPKSYQFTAKYLWNTPPSCGVRHPTYAPSGPQPVVLQQHSGGNHSASQTRSRQVVVPASVVLGCPVHRVQAPEPRPRRAGRGRPRRRVPRPRRAVALRAPGCCSTASADRRRCRSIATNCRPEYTSLTGASFVVQT